MHNLKIRVIKSDYFIYLKSKVKYSTFETNERKMNIYIFEYFAKKNIKYINKITVKECLIWQEYINSCNLSYNYKSSLYYCLCDFLDYCTKFYNLKENTARKIGNFKNKEIKKDNLENVFSLEEFNRFINTVEDKTYHALFTFLYFTGVRKGEALALTFRDINFSTHQVTINKTITKYLYHKQKLITSPKTTSSNRIITIDDSLLKELEELKAYYNCSNDAFVFGNDKSIAFTTLKRKKDYYCDLANVKHITIHEFRHSHACLLFQNNVQIEDIQHRLGHSNISMTMNTYLKYLPNNEKRVLLTLNSLRQP